MAFIDLKIYSEELKMQTSVCVLLPVSKNKGEIGIDKAEANNDQKLKCLYLLHGLSDDQTIWMRRTSIERYADKYGICVIMPCGDRSFYTDMKYGGKYYSYVARELPQKIQEIFKVSEKREDNFIAGLSMGGYGALKIGLRECDRFSAAAGLSSAVDMKARLNNPTFLPIFGETDEVPEDDDVFKLAEKCAKSANKPKIYLGAGLEDGIYHESVELKAKFEELGYDLTYRESHGNHSWAFWDEYIQYVLEWMFGEKK